MSGDTPHLILVPGLLCTEILWQAQVSGLADVADIVVTDEHRRHENIGDIASAILAAAPPRFSIAGLSFGGYICFEVMRQAAERVDRLALLDTDAGPDDEARLQLRRQMVDQAQKGRFIGVTDRLLPQFIHPDRTDDDVLVSDVKAMAQDIGLEGFVRQQTAIMGRPDSRPDLASIDCPTLILVGRQDSRTPLSVHDTMHQGIQGSELVVIEDCGHLSTLERPAQVNAAMRAWLSAPNTAELST